MKRCEKCGGENEDFANYCKYCGAACLALGIVLLFLYKKSTTGNKTITESTHQVYRFREDGVVAETYEGEVKTSEQFVRYEQISRIRCAKTLLYIYFGNLVWLMSRDTYTLGSEWELKSLLVSKGVKGAKKI